MNLFLPTLYLLFTLGASMCFGLHHFGAVPIVLAASIPALFISFVPFNKTYKHHPYAVFYTGCFAGMCSTSVITEVWHVAIISLIGTCLYYKSIGLFEGFGGRLGGIAFTCVALFVLVEGLV